MHRDRAEEFSMPIHDWTRVRANRFHDFHQSWTIAIRNALNAGRLPQGYFAMVEQKANRITVRHPDGDVVAVIEIVSPGNKDSRHALRSFVRKAVDFLQAGVHLLIVDLFPPSPRDPQGIHKAIWDRVRDEPFVLPPDKPLTVVAYSAGAETVAYVEPVAVGDPLPEMPLFLTSDRYVFCPLEPAYQTAWDQFPAPLKGPLENASAS
jgi:hypothetical protein